MPIRNQPKQIDNNRHFWRKLRVRTAVALAFLAFSSCTDQGCIEADDFGEYETQTIEVPANALSSSCAYDASLDLTDTAQGSGVKACFVSGTVTIYDSSGQESTSKTGCAGFNDNPEVQNLCINNCVQTCLTSSTTNSASAEPNWTSTDQRSGTSNYGVTIEPDSEIIVTALGTIHLGNAVDYPTTYVQTDNFKPHSKASDWSDIFFDASTNQALTIKFSGLWNDGTNDVGAGTSTFNGTATDSKIYNGARRFVAYLIPHPSGYSFDTTATSEKLGSKGVPLLPDPVAWTCDYSSATDLTESNCYNIANGYTNNGYTNVDDNMAASVFPITSNSDQSNSVLTTYGGMIRWNGDGLQNDTYDPFASATCDNNGACSNTVNNESGTLIGDASSSGGVEITNNYSNAYKVSFRALNSGCNNTNFNVNIKNTSDNILYSFSPVLAPSDSWSTNHITLEAGQKLAIGQITATYGNSINCGRAIAVRFTKYHEIKIQQSGFVRFTILNGLTGQSCGLKGRIINPSGSFSDETFSSNGAISGFTADFYEYDSFGTSNSTDPLASLTVAASTSSSLNWSSRIFVRKGQTIRFSPESWNNNWNTANSLSRQCGIGIAMQIEPRPSLLCRGVANDDIQNPSCVADYNSSGTLIGCQAIANECSDGTNATYYCPLTSCQQTVTGCSDGTASNNYAKTGCSLTGTIDSATCTSTASPYYTPTTCGSCSQLLLSRASQAAMSSIGNMNQCYDLENYKGKIANIPSSTGFSTAQLADSSLSKGATKLTTFNGSYGNFENFSDTGTTDASAFNQRIFQTKSPIIFSSSGRLRFFMLDGDDFNNTNGAELAYSNNSSSGSTYGSSNGFKVALSGNLDFNNGKWLQARLCQESGDNTVDCKTSDPTPLDGQPRVIDITTPSSPTDSPNITSHYKFDVYGNITRTSNAVPGEGDCTAANNGIESATGALFYCHTRDKNSNKLRLTFKILDPESGNCNLSGTNDGVKISNPNYDSSKASNVGATCDPDDSCQYYCASRYANNSGLYYVTVKSKIASSDISSMIGGVIQPVIELMDGPKRNCLTGTKSTDLFSSTPDYDGILAEDGVTCNPVAAGDVGQAERIYKLLIADSRYQAILTMSLVVMYSFYGVGYLMGVSSLSHSELTNRVIKIGLIYLFIGETGWDWFNSFVVKFFKNGTDYLAFMMASAFDSSPEIARAIANTDFYDKSVLFSSVDKVFAMCFSQAVMKKISALLFASIFGWAYLLIILSSFMLYVYAVANAVLLYLTAQVFISILFTLGPIFFLFTLFNQTKEMFDNWLKQLISFSLQQVFLLTTLAFFNMLIYEVIKMSLGYKVCWDEVWTINIITRITLLSFWTIASLPPRTNAQSEVGNIGNPDGIPSLFTILFIWVIASLMNKFITFMTDIAAGIAGGLKASELGKGIADTANSIKKIADDKIWGDKGLWGKRIAPILHTMDRDIFDSGKLADAEREKRTRQNKQDINNKTAMADAGNKAVADYKRNNAAELIGKTKKEQAEILVDVKHKAMHAKGKELGVNETDRNRLISEKGFKYEGKNVFGAAIAATRQALGGGGTIARSLSERETSTAFTTPEAKKALEKMDKDKRKEFIEAAEKGKIEVQQSGIGASLKGARKGIGSAFSETGKIMHDKDYDKAARELEDEGTISKMTAGTNWARTDAEKKEIRKRQKENMERKKAEFKPQDIDAVTALKMEEEYLAQAEEIDKKEVGFFERMTLPKNYAKSMARYDISAKKDKIKAEVAVKASEGLKTSTQQELAEMQRTETNAEGKSVRKGKLADSEARQEIANQQLIATREAMTKEFGEAEKIAELKRAGRPADDKEMQDLQASLNKKKADNPGEFEKLDKQLKTANVAKHGADIEVAGYKEKFEALQSFEKATTSAHEALEEYKSRATASLTEEDRPDNAKTAREELNSRIDTNAQTKEATQKQLDDQKKLLNESKSKLDEANARRSFTSKITFGTFGEDASQKEERKKLAQSYQQEKETTERIEKSLHTQTQEEERLNNLSKAMDRANEVYDQAENTFNSPDASRAEREEAEITMKRYTDAATAEDFAEIKSWDQSDLQKETPEERKFREVAEEYAGQKAAEEFKEFTEKNKK